ncbi:MAG: DUF6449 domain-containing protein [Bacillota bacterium]|nr:DUF6449 domain-containing protein [Bacillota bacterium]
MLSKTSRLNKEIIKQIFRSVGWISILYFLGLLFCLPLTILMWYSGDEKINYMKVTSLFQYDFPIQLLLMVIVPVLLSVFLFRFLHVKQATDFMHSLPLRRERIFHHYALTGVLFLVVPVAVISVIIVVLHSALGLTAIFTLKMVFVWTGITLLVNLLLYTVGVFVAMMTGISAVQAVLTYIVLFFPVGITLILFFNLKILLYGFPIDYFINQDLEKMSPITYASILEQGHFQTNIIVIYAVCALIFYCLGLFFYKKRKHEAVSEAIAFLNLRSVFKYGTTFCTMLAGGMYFSEVSNGNLSWIVFGYAVGTLLGYFLAEMVLQKTWRVFTRLKGLGIFSAAMVLLVLAIQFSGFYDHRIPEQNEIKSVLLTDNANRDVISEDTMAKYYLQIPMSHSENIEAVRKLHKQIIEDKSINQKSKLDQTQIAFLTYTLKNGETVRREYRINRSLYDDFYKPIYESEEYKRNSNAIFKVNENKIRALSISPNGPIQKNLVISEPADIKEAIRTLREDVLEESYADSLYFQNQGTNLEIRLGKREFLNMEIKSSYQNFNGWLKEKGWLDRASVTAEDIDYILIGKSKGQDIRNDVEILKDLEKQPDRLKVTDPTQIQLALDRRGWANSKYVAYFHYKIGKFSEIFFFDDEHAPDYVKSHFE